MTKGKKRTEQQWLDESRSLMLRGDFVQAGAFVSAALDEFPTSLDLRRTLAGVFLQTGQTERAETILRDIFRERPQDSGAAFALAKLLFDQLCPRAAGQVLRGCLEPDARDAELAIRAIEMLDEADRKADAAAIAEAAVAATPDDARLHAYAGMLELQLGEFERAREHCLFALAHSANACEWHVPHGLASAQRYTEAIHPDFARFGECIQRTDLSVKARSSLLFALGKAFDDIGDYEQAAVFFRKANTLARSLTRWSRKDWRRAVEARLAAHPIALRGVPTNDFTPVFIVGMPRSGTTLFSELLARDLRVTNRGELPWIAKLAGQPDLNGDPSLDALEHASRFYKEHARRDDVNATHWIIDKQPLNFRYVDLILALFPKAKIIHCVRNERDTALSIWTQSFLEEAQGYAFDFDDISVVMRDCNRLMKHWKDRYPQSIRTVRYEQVVTQPEKSTTDALAWLGIHDGAPSAGRHISSISTASLWQARQSVYSRSVRRWIAYASHVPELLRFTDA